MSRKKRARSARLRPQSCGREFFAFGALEGAEDDIEDGQRVGKILVVMFRESRMMDAMDLRRNDEVVKPRQMNANGRVIKHGECHKKHRGIERCFSSFG